MADAPQLTGDREDEITADLVARAASLSLEEKVLLLTGGAFFATAAMEKIGLRRIVVSDGPSGVRGEVWDERSPSLNLPSATALAAAWDTDLARRYGAASAVEARRKGVDVVLGPTINLHRSPLGGRHFEAFSEDPTLTAELAASFVDGVQSNGVGATLKHYVANDFETERFTVDVRVSDRALRELYLLAFEKAVVESKAWLVMSAYNSINGATATENGLLETPLTTEWGFDGVVISDWTAVRTLESARHRQDLVMPGPEGPWGDALVAAVRSGDIEEGLIDAKVINILRLASRVGALEGYHELPADQMRVEDGVAFAREASAAGSVLVHNTGELPWSAESIRRIAVIGHNAQHARSQGGGSATVIPERVVSPLDGISRALPGAEISYSIGAVVQQGIIEWPLERMTNPATGQPGILTRFLDASGNELLVENRFSANLVWFGGTAPVAQTAILELRTNFIPETSGGQLIGVAAAGHVRMHLDGVLVLDTVIEPEGQDLGAALLSPPPASIPVSLEAGVPVDVRVEYVLSSRSGEGVDAISCIVGSEPRNSDPDGLIAEAVRAAEAAEVVLLVVGTNSRVESEGFDRDSLVLPGHQDRLVAAVAKANPRTVVVVNAGAPVLMPWRDDVAAILLGWFGGQEFGDALADVLLGHVEPGGRLPTTWPALERDVPVIDVTPRQGVLRYDEGIHVGYRAWLKAETAPAYPFGHGLGYTTWELSDLSVTVLPGELAGVNVNVNVNVTVTNVGSREGKHVVQLYASRHESDVDRPLRWLAGFAPVVVAAGSRTVVTIHVPARAFAHWDDGWNYEPGEYTLHVGNSVADLPLSESVSLFG